MDLATLEGKPRRIFAPHWMLDFMRYQKTPFEAVANRAWLFRTFGIQRGMNGTSTARAKT